MRLLVNNKTLLFPGGIYAVVLIAISRLTGFDGLYGQDSYNYLRQANDFLLLGTQGEFWPPAYAWLGWMTGTLIHDCTMALQMISALSVALTGIVLINILTYYYSNYRHIALFVFLCYLLSPFVLRSGVIVMSDALATMFCVCTVYFTLLSQLKNKIFFVFLFATLAFLCRYATVIVVAPFCIYSIYCCLVIRNFTPLALGIILSSFLLHLNFAYWANREGSIHHAWLQNWSIANFFRREFVTPDGSSCYTLPNIAYVFKNIYYPGFLLLFLPIVHFIKPLDFSGPHQKLLLISVIVYALFLGGIPFQNDRFLLLTFPFVLLLLYPAFNRMMEYKPLMKYVILAAALLSVPLALRAIYPLYQRNQLEKQIAEQLYDYRGRTLYSFDIDIALRGRDCNFIYKNMWQKKYDLFEKGSLVLFNEEKFKEQWKDKNPMLNFTNLKKNYTLSIEKKLPEGWTLFSIQ